MSEAPAEMWIRRSDGGYYRTMLEPPEPSAVRYVRADLYEALVIRLRAAMESAEDNDMDGVERILRTALKLHLEADCPR